MKNSTIYTKVLQVFYKKNNTTAIRRTLCYAAVLLGVVALLTGCPDSMGDDNGGTQTEATLVQSAASGTISATAVTLTWALPTDTDGYLGVTIIIRNTAGILLGTAGLNDSATEYQATNLEPATEYVFTIITRYTASNKDNDTTIPVTTLSLPTEATKVQNATSGASTINTITLTWDLPIDIDGLLGVTISEEDASGSLSSAVAVDTETTTYEVTGLEPGTMYTFTIATRYTDSGKNNDDDVTGMTALATEVQRVVLDAAETTSDSVTITWENPIDEEGYTGVTISAASTVGDLDMNTPRMVASDTNTLTISSLTAETEHTFTLSFGTEYDDTNKNSSSSHDITVTTQSNRVSGTVATTTTGIATITLRWEDPEDTVEYAGVTISANPAAGNLNMPEMINASGGSTAGQLDITGLATFTSYDFTISTRYNGTKSGADRTITMRTFSTNAIDRDGDDLIDINSLERLDNVRYNLDLGATSDDGRYKESTQIADGEGVRCGANADAKCTGYELMRSLDFNDGDSYESGSVNAEWRPTGGDPATATNAGWDPIGGSFASRFEGNGYTISNLYARNTSSSGANIGLFNTIAAGATVRSIGIQSAALYGSSSNNDYIGGLVGSSSGSIIASYAHNTTADGGAGGNDRTGGLVGDIINSNARIVASYASEGTISGGVGSTDLVGGLVGFTGSGVVIASYASGGTVSGGITDGGDQVGGLVGNMNFNSLVIAAYSTAAANGGSGSTNHVGGLVGINLGNINASYATGTADGSTSGNNNNDANALYGSRAGSVGDGITDSYGFGMVVNHNGLDNGSNGNNRPTRVTAATGLTAVNVPATWNRAADDTLQAWDFGNSTQIPALRYADYDGESGNDYGCTDADTPTSSATIVIPPVVASPDGPLIIVCGKTLLPGQRP